MKKLLISLFILSVLISSSIAHASALGNLSFWESNTGQIGRWDVTPKVYLDDNVLAGTFTTSQMNTYLTYARNQWSNAGISTTSTSSSSAEITYYGRTPGQMSSLFAGLSGNELGYCNYFSMSYEGTWNHSSGLKIGQKFSKIDVYLIYFAGTSADRYRHVSTHELGHALGWMGHASGNSNVMSPNSPSPILNLTDIDKRHLVPVYY